MNTIIKTICITVERVDEASHLKVNTKMIK